jgi:Ca2+-binding RTX toxin-like protein
MLATGLVLAMAVPAAAATGPSGTCTFDGTSHVVSVTVSADYTLGHIAEIAYESGAIKLYLLDGVTSGVQTIDCGATTSEAASIEVTGSSGPDYLILLSIGPGFGSEATGAPEIEWSVDLGGGEDRLNALGESMAVGTLGINLNYDDDADVAMTSVEELGLSASDASGAVTLTAAGGKGTGSVLNTPVTLLGGPGNDTLVGGNGGDLLTGGAGNDRELGGAGADELGAASSNDPFDDAGRNLLIGGSGGDTFTSGAGYATVSYADRTAAVSVTLNGLNDDGATGEHDNVAADIEAVIGGSGADVISAAAVVLSDKAVSHRFSGGAGADKLSGGPVADVLLAGGGKDVLKGLDGGDDLRGGPADDKLYGGEGVDALDGEAGTDVCSGGPAADIFEHCEKRS